MYIFDTSPLSTLFKNYYRKRFPTLWSLFDDLVKEERLTSTREVFREIQIGPIHSLTEWATERPNFFSIPGSSEGQFLTQIFSIPHFRQNIEQQKFYKGGSVADPFVIAKAGVESKTVVTMEEYKPNSAKIPNICEHFDIRCLTLEEFMEAEGWSF